MSRLRAPLMVARARLRAQPGRSLLVVLGVATSTAMMLGVIGGSLVARDRAVQRSLAALAPGDRSFRVDAFQLPAGETYPAADRQARAALSLLSSEAPLRATFFRELRIDRELTQLVGLDNVRSFVRLRSGRLPRACDPGRCEVLQIGTAGRARLDEGGIHLVRVGVADFTGGAAFGTSVQNEQVGGESPVLLLAPGGHVFDALPAFDGIYRAYSWIAPIEPRRLHQWEISAVLAGETRAQRDLARVGDVFRLSGPDQALAAAQAGGRVSAQRMALIGGGASALLLGFALVVALGLRRGLANERRRLRQRGASAVQTRTASAAEIGMLTVAGTAAGVATAVGGIVLLAGAAGLPQRAVVGHALGSWTVVAVVVASWALSTVALIVVALGGERDSNRRVGLLDVAALGALGAIGLGLVRGGLDQPTLATNGSRTLLLLLPMLVCFVAAVVVARLLRPVMRQGERLARRSDAVVPRLALLALARSPARTTATAAFLVVGVGLVFFATSWRATLQRGASDQAAFQAPLDAILTEGTALGQPLAVASLRGYESLAPGTRAYPVVRRLADVAGEGTSVASPTLLGLPVAALKSLRWRGDFSSASPAELARRVGADGPARLRTLPLPAPAGERIASLPVVLHGDPVQLELVLGDRDGTLETVSLGERAAGVWSLAARLPRRATGLVGLRISLAASTQLGFTHRDAESEAASIPGGSASVGSLSVGGGRVTDWHGFVGRQGLAVRAGSPLRLGYSFTEGQAMILRLRQPTDGRPLRVVVSPEIAQSVGSGGSFVLDVQGTQLPALVVGVASRFPAAEQQGEGFVVADESRLRTALDAEAPGAGAPGEVWLATRDPERLAAALQQPRFAPLVVTSRTEIERTLARDPLARGIELALVATAAAALVLSLLGFAVALVSVLRDERGELFDLEAQGVGPKALRQHLRLRAGLLLGFALVAAGVLGLVLSRLVVSVVRVSATGSAAEPPLQLEIGWGAIGVAVAAMIAVSALAVELTARGAFRAPVPERAAWSLE